ncbi:hypothetical protein WAI453_011516 [Rhynchosporium graminicola]
MQSITEHFLKLGLADVQTEKIWITAAFEYTQLLSRSRRTYFDEVISISDHHCGKWFRKQMACTGMILKTGLFAKALGEFGGTDEVGVKLNEVSIN